ncbi:hypothetical protein GCK32_011460 [Trichostrongylus colubriformis]|uniref:Uncharacterized protein n=1 Tax=Trichostrongylus colubriformis TaxID=6319 RepID=A0AAN8FHM9_TRICO
MNVLSSIYSVITLPYTYITFKYHYNCIIFFMSFWRILSSIIQVCNYRGYVKLNRTKFEKDVLDLKRGLEKKLLGKTESMIPDEQEIGSFLRSNAWLLTGFAAGWLLGFGIA